jgi:hypothetical protein
VQLRHSDLLWLQTSGSANTGVKLLNAMYQFSCVLYIEGTITSAKDVGVVQLCGGGVFQKLCQALFSSVLNLR